MANGTETWDEIQAMTKAELVELLMLCKVPSIREVITAKAVAASKRARRMSKAATASLSTCRTLDELKVNQRRFADAMQLHERAQEMFQKIRLINGI